MPRYIDADEFDTIVNGINIYGEKITKHDYILVDKILSRFSTADVVEVVRCKDCKYRDGLDGQCPVQSTGDPFYDYIPDDNWYCGSGERRE